MDNQFYETNCYIRGTSLAATYNYCNGEKSGYIYYVQNAHGDVVNLTDAEGAVTKTYHYDAFGVELSPVTGDVNAFRYCGEYFDTETGTIYLRARYYQASTGRFTQRDTVTGKLSDPLSLNLYTYAHNNPIFYFDPSGHSVLSEFRECWISGSKDIAECHKMGTSVIQEAVKENKGTLALTSGGTAQAGPLSVGASSGFCMDWKGNIGFMYTYTYSFDPRNAENPECVLESLSKKNNLRDYFDNLSLNISGTVTNADEISDLDGNGLEGGISGIPAGDLGIDISGCVGFKGETTQVANYGTTIGLCVNSNPAGVGVSYDYSYTTVLKIGNIYDWAYKIDDAILSW